MKYISSMSKIFCVFLIVLASTICRAQPITNESVRLSEVFLDSTWATQEQAMPVLIAGVEAQLRQAGISDHVSIVFSRELKKTLSRENTGKALAAIISLRLTPDESKDLIAFLQSSLGKKYLQLAKEMGSSKSFIAQIFKPACEASSKQLDSVERKQLQSLCGY